MNSIKILKNPFSLLIFVIVLSGCTSQTPKEDEDIVCTMEYLPVCAEKQVQCIQAPCPPIEQTYSNACEATKAGATIVHEGVCKEPREKARDALIAQVSISSPSVGETISSPLSLAGEAPGSWFFEATAPVRLLDSMGVIIAEGYVSAEGDRMTEDIVSFAGTLEYTLQGFLPSKSATLVFASANASGLKEHDASIEIPVVFE